ncbi:expressed unknown protein [Seminavis robusta]|uniref:Uncharacterized protein n=1 Tax=Seminavis robusta TaxID=568900 RepID=A0A9N8DYZ4_9STRA|nr:expressed unknown protein [Seminavis robusta]|eukprot:Sro353_g124640.1 n/a (302) ;mRNA; r:62378-63505
MMSSRLMSSALTSLTRRMGGVSLYTVKKPTTTMMSSSYSTLGGSLTIPSSTTTTVLPVLGSLNAMDGPFWQVSRSVTRKKRLERRRKRKEAARKEAKMLEGQTLEETEEVAAPQHEAWVDFQKSISVKGFQTGQITKARVRKKGEIGLKLKDHKRREKLEMRMAAKRPELADVRGGEFPTKRYSDEETERLLELAYAAIPPRAGKRGTRNLRRQSRRWFLVRKIHRKYKQQKIAAHFRLMEERSKRMQEIKAVKAEAPDTRARDRAYQRQVLQRWMKDLKSHQGGFEQVIQAEATVIEDKS